MDDKPIAEVVPKLEGCPFCGALPTTGRQEQNPYVSQGWLVCMSCGATGPRSMLRGGAVAAWNRRASGCAPATPPAVVAALVEALERISRGEYACLAEGMSCGSAQAPARAALARYHAATGAKEGGV
jgi:Lar family restriction alleviation protein